MPVMGKVYLSGMYTGASWIASYPGGGDEDIVKPSCRFLFRFLSPVWKSGECLGCNLMQHQKVMGYVMLD